MKGNKSIFLKIYFITTLLYGLFGLYDAIFVSNKVSTYGDINIFYQTFVIMFGFLVMILSISAIIYFIHEKLSKILLIMPIYQLIMKIILFLVGLIFAIYLGTTGISYNEVITPFSLIIVQIITSLFEVILSGYILQKYKI